MIKEIFYQASLPRSGSTLLQNILAQNPDFYATPTSGLIDLLLSARNKYADSFFIQTQDTNLMEQAYKGFCAAASKGFFEAISDKVYAIDKSRSWLANLDFLNFYQESPKVICMVRDPRAIISSLEKIARTGRATSMTHGAYSHGLQGVTTAMRVEEWQNHMYFAESMRDVSQVLLEGKGKDICFVKYEHLMKDPDGVMKTIYSYLKIPSFTHDFNNIDQSTHEEDIPYLGGSDHIIRNVLEGREDDYNQILGIELSETIKENHKWFFDNFNYN